MKGKMDLFLSVSSLFVLLVGLYLYWFTEDRVGGAYMVALAGVIKP